MKCELISLEQYMHLNQQMHAAYPILPAKFLNSLQPRPAELWDILPPLPFVFLFITIQGSKANFSLLLKD